MVKRRLISVLIICCMIIPALAGCGAQPSGGGQSLEYRDMKQMVIDILKTEDAQKALQEQTASSGGLRALSASDQEEIKLAVKEVLVSPDYDKVIEKLMTDTRFAGEFAKAVNKQNKQIHKDLLKDPSYQQDLLAVMKGPEMEKVILDAMNSAKYRKQVVTIMQESMQSPIIKMQLYELLREAVKEELNPKEKRNDSQKKDGSTEESGGSEEESGQEGGDEGGEGGNSSE